MKKFFKVLLIFLVVAAILGAGIFAYLRFVGRDMTGNTYEEIEAFQNDHPNITVTYTVTIEGGSEPLVIDQAATDVVLSAQAQADSLISKAGYLHELNTIDVCGLAFTPQQLDALEAAFPNAAICYDIVTLLGTDYPLSATELDLSHITADRLEDVIAASKWLSDISKINLIGADGSCNLTTDEALSLHKALPNVNIDFTTTLFGQKVSTDMERLEYVKVNIGDAGLEKIREILPMMYNLTYLKLDWCNTSDEATAQLRDDFAPQGIKVVWRVEWSVFDSLTDNLKMWSIGGLMNKQIGAFKYMTDVKYIDLGHNYFSDLSFLQYMPDLEVAILAINHEIEDLSYLSYCKNLVFLEIFSTEASDLSPLAECKELRYLNISNMPVTDLTPLYELENLEYLWCTVNRNKIPAEQFEEFKRLHPDCKVFYSYDGDPTEYGWRKDPITGELTPQYAMVREIFGYDKDDVSQFPKGYMTEPVVFP